MSAPAWWDDVPAVPSDQPRSLQEAAELVFASQDALTRADAEADKQRRRSQALKTDAIRDEAEVRAWLGRPAPSAVEHYLQVSEVQDRLEERERKHRQRLRAERAEARVAELEQQLAQAELDRTRSLRTLTEANEAAAAFRRRSEGAGFPDDPVVGYRRVRDGAVEVRSSEVPRVRSGGPILGIR